MIKTFGCRDTERLFQDKRIARFQAVECVARRKLLYLHAADSLQALGASPGNRLERLKGDRMGQYSIRVNQQWRICFHWINGNAYNVEIVDYH